MDFAIRGRKIGSRKWKFERRALPLCVLCGLQMKKEVLRRSGRLIFLLNCIFFVFLTKNKIYYFVYTIKKAKSPCKMFYFMLY